MVGMQRYWYRFSSRTWPWADVNLRFLVDSRRRATTISVGTDVPEPEDERPVVTPQRWSPIRPALRMGAAAQVCYPAVSPDRAFLRTDASDRLVGPSEARRR